MSTNDRPTSGPRGGPYYEGLTTFVDGSEDVHVVVETPRHAASKFKFDEKLQLFVLKTALPKGLVFPYDFGFVPRTRGEDGDPLDVLLLQEEPTFTGCVVAARVLGAIRASQRENGKHRARNDRFVAIPRGALDGTRPRSLAEVDRHTVAELETFFVTFGRSQEKTVEIEGHSGPSAAVELIRTGMRRFERDGPNGQ